MVRRWFVNPGIDKLTLNNLREREVFASLIQSLKFGRRGAQQVTNRNALLHR